MYGWQRRCKFTDMALELKVKLSSNIMLTPILVSDGGCSYLAQWLGLVWLGLDYNDGFRSPIWPWSQRSVSKKVKLFLTALNVNSSYLFWLEIFISGIIIAYGVLIITKFHIANMTLESKVKVKIIYLKYVIWLGTQTPLVFAMESAYIWQMIAYGVYMTTTDLYSCNDLWVKGQMYLKFVLWLLMLIPTTNLM